MKPTIFANLRPLAVDGLGAAALLLIAATVYMAFVQPHSSRANALSAQAIEAGELEQRASEMNAELSRLEGRKETLSGEADKMLRLTSVGRLNDRLKALADLADSISHTADEQASAAFVGPPTPRWLTEAASVKILQIVPGAPTRTAKFVTVPIRLAGTASFASATQFLNELHKQFPDTAVARLSLVVDESAQNQAADSATGGAGTSESPSGSRNPGRSAPRAAISVDLVWCAAPEESAGSAGESHR